VTRSRAVWIAALLLCLAAPNAWAQLPLPLGSPQLPPGVEPPRRGPITITPSITVTGEYNDNIFQSNANKVSDYILGLSPGISVAVENPIYRLIGSYSFTAEVYADNDQLNDVFARQSLRLDGSYRVTPLLTASLSDAFTVNKNTNVVTAENVSTGRTRAISNTLSPGVAYQIDPLTTARVRGTWTTQHYETAAALDSDVYAVEGFVDHAFTPRLTGTAGYQFAYFDVERSPVVTTHTPRIGVTYRFTPTLTAIVNGGPTIQVPENGSVGVFPAVTASLQQRFGWGAASLQYDRAVSTAGGLGGTTENQSIGATVQVDRLVRGLVLQAVPRYTKATSTIGNTIDIESFSLTLQARYEITRYIAAIAGYTYFHQTANGTTVTTAAGTIIANDVDQNRVFVGLQFGYPITID
jgi:hypothetical protein